MEAETRMREIALADPTVAAIFGTRWYPMALPATKVLPAVTVLRVAGPRHHDIPFAFPLIQVTVWAENWTDLRNGANAIRDALNRVKDGTGYNEVKQIAQENEIELRDPETGFLTMPMDFRCIHREGD